MFDSQCKILTPGFISGNWDKSPMDIAIPRATAMKTTQEICSKIIIKSRWNLKNVQVMHKKARGTEMRSRRKSENKY